MKSAAAAYPMPRLPVWRSRLLLAGILLWFVALVVRAVYLQGLNNDFLKQKGESRYARVIDISATRGMSNPARCRSSSTIATRSGASAAVTIRAP